MEFEIRSDGDEIILTVSTHQGGFEFDHKFEHPIVADWIAEMIEIGMDERIQEIRKTAYLQGRRSAHNKRLKCTEFNGCINSNQVGW